MTEIFATILGLIVGFFLQRWSNLLDENRSIGIELEHGSIRSLGVVATIPNPTGVGVLDVYEYEFICKIIIHNKSTLRRPVYGLFLNFNHPPTVAGFAIQKTENGNTVHVDFIHVEPKTSEIFSYTFKANGATDPAFLRNSQAVLLYKLYGKQYTQKVTFLVS